MSSIHENAERIRKALFKRADECLKLLEQEYEIDANKANEIVYTVTRRLYHDEEATVRERWRGKKSFQVSFASRFATVKSNYEKFRVLEDWRAAQSADELVKLFNEGLSHGAIRRRHHMEDRDIRGLILNDIYKRKKKGEEVFTRPEQYADLLGVPRETTSFDLEYLINKGLVKGNIVGGLGTTKKYSMVYDITSDGVDAVEGQHREQYEVNFNLVNVGGDLSGQVAMGTNISQKQESNIGSFEDLYLFAEQNLRNEELKKLKPLLEEVEEQFKSETVKPSTLKQISSLLVTYGPIGVTIIRILGKLLGLSL